MHKIWAQDRIKITCPKIWLLQGAIVAKNLMKGVDVGKGKDYGSAVEKSDKQQLNQGVKVNTNSDKQWQY